VILTTLVGLSGCVTTQQENARTVLLNERTLATESSVDVTREDPAVRVLGLDVVRGRDDAALTVRILNTSERPLTDLPISVGLLTTTGQKIYLNRTANISYYDTHVPAIGAGELTTWVYTARQLPGNRGRPFAEVGIPRLPLSTAARRLPKIDATSVLGARPGSLRVSVSNRSGIPQYGLQVYAVAVRGGRAVGAARGAISELDGGAEARIALKLVGSTAGAQVHIYAAPTIFA
jgi:hypothetical protein